MLTEPKIVERRAQPYVAIRKTVQIPFGDTIDATMPKLWKWIGEHQVEPVGPPFFKYNIIDMAKGLEIEFGAPVATVRPADDLIVTGTLPAGSYATVTYHGHYDGLMDATATLLGWADREGHKLDMQPTPKGDKFACRLEIYPNDPKEVPEPENWETVLAFKLAES